MIQNPWQEQHKRRERVFQDHPEIGDALVDGEYLNAPPPRKCTAQIERVGDCNGDVFYKATIGAMKCTRCGALYHTNGDPI